MVKKYNRKSHFFGILLPRVPILKTKADHFTSAASYREGMWDSVSAIDTNWLSALADKKSPRTKRPGAVFVRSKCRN